MSTTHPAVGQLWRRRRDGKSVTVVKVTENFVWWQSAIASCAVSREFFTRKYEHTLIENGESDD